MTRVWARWILVVVVLLAASGVREDAAEKFKTPEGRTVTLAGVLGRATLVVFFFPSCTYCAASYPGVAGVDAANKASGLSTVWINVLPEQAKQVDDWRKAHGYEGVVLNGGASAQRDYKLLQTPTWYLLDAQGAPVWRHDGYVAGDEAALAREVAKALAASP